MSKEQPIPESRCVSPGELAAKAGVPPQMIYNYISAGRIPAAKCSDHARWCIDIDDAVNWMLERREKEKAKYDKIQRQLKGGSG